MDRTDRRAQLQGVVMKKVIDKDLAAKLARIKELQKENAVLRKKKEEQEVDNKFGLSILKKHSEEEVLAHLWKRCRNMESKDYFWFKNMSKVVKWYGKEWSEKQADSMLPIISKYWNTKETKKPKDVKKINPHS